MPLLPENNPTVREEIFFYFITISFTVRVIFHKQKLKPRVYHDATSNISTTEIIRKTVFKS